SLRCSCTRRTARALTSGEYLFDLFMAPSSQILKPPQNPGRFSISPTKTLAKLANHITEDADRKTRFV
ncbi:hypothetical protein, partial [Nitrosomonas eutropha]|uniref:hypothetical protein n=1 Tax=Nitrosomonas eutropha TaxID=916 RepID=UPI001C435E7E